MNSRKNHNSILFLTTLGVYLGLMLVGSTPVLGHAAMTRNFEIKDEIEIKDDLDTKPNDCELRDKINDYETKFLWFNHRSIGEYANLLEQVLNAYPEKIDGVDVSWKSVGELRPSRKVNTEVAYPFGFLDTETSLDLDRAVLYVGNGLPGKAFTFSVLRNIFGSQFRFESQQIPYDAPLVRALYSSALDFTRCSYGSANLGLILKNSELTVEGDHLVITTRLPRGSLDSLLAKSAK